ncbi:MAG: S-adenosyl-L-methionine-dependent 2-deoxy-scyllo-inosamine dehydrogenase [Pelotomaculum sp. PtaB.Bin104]|nr:MAG: S-adenosyl-L-methionine-dependent 2-deoxy-scyllo-inosamine dehydrogenase [Pelotomaculum sp. PtaB.Bin104]
MFFFKVFFKIFYLIREALRNSLAFRYLKYLRILLFKPTLNRVEIETTTICNRKCSYCPNFTVGRPEELMDEKVYYKIIDSLKRYGYKKMISPHFYGEPLTDSRLPKLMSYTKKNLPEAKIVLFTNGDLLTINKFLELKDAGVDFFRISQHSKQLPRNVLETIQYIRASFTNSNDILQVVNYYDMYHKNKIMENRGGLVKVRTRKQHYCDYVNNMIFDYQGNAIICCNDYKSSIIFGNIKENEVVEIWNDKNYVKIRNLISNGFWPYQICKICKESLPLHDIKHLK